MQNKPKLRFKEFNNDWEDKSFNDYCLSISSGKSKKRSVNGIYNLYGSTGIIGKIDTVDYNGKYLLVARVGANAGYTYKINDQCGISDNTLVINLRSNLLIDYIYYYLRNWNLNRLVFGSGQPLVTGGMLKKIKVKVPCLDEQKKIAEFLSKVDEVIAEREEEVKDLEKQKKGLMQKIFSQQLRFTDSNNNPYPDWKEKKIGDVFEFYNGKAHEQEIDENGEYIVVNSKFISTEGQVKKYTNKVICPLKKDDIVLVMSDVPNGKAMSKCYLIEEDNKYSLNQRICCLRTKDVARFFIYQISRNKYFLKFDNGVSQTNLRKEDVLKCPIQVPCLEEQQKIANVLSKLDELIEEKKALLSDWQSFKKGLLQQMFV